ncbi:FecCD family ABC transporter permease [Delftia sp. PS-11]|uniref:FecCD family ABC transporter permease n=1 Tax=Delftia sp. PS-11 TaxID=2767222 RepID=UPI0024579A4E|nr:iron ABC transporter permease [Delftia sp. PS-11]
MARTDMLRPGPPGAGAWCLLLCAVLLLAMTLAITWGSVDMPASTVWRIAASRLLQTLGISTGPLPLLDGISQQHQQIVWLIRMPRVLLAALVGAGLAVVGTIMQAMVRNPLADPYLLGVSSGASVGAVSVLAFGALASAGMYALTAGAFAGALAATVAVYLLARSHGRIHATRLILGGVAIGYVLAGVTSLITLSSGQRDLASALLTWTLGSLAGTQWQELGMPAGVLAAGLIWLGLQARELNALLAGDETAATLGVDTARLRRALFLAVSLLTGTMVAVSGAIGFVGLIVPHAARMLVGTDHRRVLPVAALAGALLLVLVDLVARVAFAPMELPVGVITSLIGGPFFVWMLVRQPVLTERSA